MQRFAIGAALIGSLLSACQESRVEQSTPSSATSEQQIRDGSSEDAVDTETVVPPTSITGSWLTATVLEETATADSATAKIALVYYYKGQKIAHDPARYETTLTVYSTLAAIQVQNMAADSAAYDRFVQIKGASLQAIREAYASVHMVLTITDRSDGSSHTMNAPVAEVLAEATAVTDGSPDAPAETTESSAGSKGSSTATEEENGRTYQGGYGGGGGGYGGGGGGYGGGSR